MQITCMILKLLQKYSGNLKLPVERFDTRFLNWMVYKFSLLFVKSYIGQTLKYFITRINYFMLYRIYLHNY